MKKIIIQLSLVFVIAFASNQMMAQVPPPPPSGHGSGGNQPAGGGAPIGGGLGILLAMGAAYGVRKIIKFNKEHSPLD